MAVNQDIPWSVWRGLQQFIRNAEISAELAKRGGIAETLWAQFQEEAVASYGVDDTTRARRGFGESGVDAGFEKVVGADEAGNAATDYQCWDVTGHRAVSILARSESF